MTNNKKKYAARWESGLLYLNCINKKVKCETNQNVKQRWAILSTIDHYRSKILLSLSIVLTSEKPIVIDSRKICEKESKWAKWTEKCKVK